MSMEHIASASRSLIPILLVSVIWSAGCGNTGKADCDIGSEWCDCTSGGACNPGLVCVDGVCVPDGGDASTDVIGDGDPDLASDTPTECADDDEDGVCNEDDVCPGGDDTVDSDGDTIPDFCDCEGMTCGDNAHCEDTGDGPECVCDDGYEGDGYTCAAIDHCASGTDTCDVNATCTYTGPGTYTCECNTGYTGDGFTCTPDTGDCHRYSESFTSGASATAQCTAWDTWKAGLPTSGLRSVRVAGTFDMTGITCTDPTVVQALADTLRTGGRGTWTCDGHDWSLCDRLSGELWLDPPSECSGSNCPDPGYLARPCISTQNWGGMNTATCNPPSQDMTVEFCE